MKTLYPWLFGVIAACSPHSSGNPALRTKAGLLHNEAVALARTLAKELRALESKPGINRDSVAAWTRALDAWNESLVEVPGHEHEHQHEHDHIQLHKHADYPDVTDQEMLLIQQALMEELEGLKERMRQAGAL